MTSADGSLKIVVLETANLEELRAGRPARTPDGSVLVAWCPDPVWLIERVKESGGDGAAIGRAIDEAAKRPQQPVLPSRGRYEAHNLGGRPT